MSPARDPRPDRRTECQWRCSAGEENKLLLLLPLGKLGIVYTNHPLLSSFKAKSSVMSPTFSPILQNQTSSIWKLESKSNKKITTVSKRYSIHFFCILFLEFSRKSAKYGTIIRFLSDGRSRLRRRPPAPRRTLGAGCGRGPVRTGTVR